MKKIIALCAAFALCASFCSCEKEQNDEDIFTVAVPIAPLGTFAQEVCGGNARIITVIPEGSDVETYEMSPKEKIALDNADIYFTLGLPSEAKIIASLPEATETVDLASAVSEKLPDRLFGTERDHHTWLSPMRAEIMVSKIAEKLAEADPENSAVYAENAVLYIDKIKEAISLASDALASLEHREILVYHPAFGYFCDEFGLTMYSVEEDGHEITAARLAEMTDLAKEKNISAVFCQREDSQKEVSSFAEYINAEVAVLAPLSPDYTENIVAMAQSIAEYSNGNVEGE